MSDVSRAEARPKKKSVGSLLAKMRWKKASKADRLAQGKMLAEARAKARKKRKEKP